MRAVHSYMAKCISCGRVNVFGMAYFVVFGSLFVNIAVDVQTLRCICALSAQHKINTNKIREQIRVGGVLRLRGHNLFCDRSRIVIYLKFDFGIFGFLVRFVSLIGETVNCVSDFLQNRFLFVIVRLEVEIVCYLRMKWWPREFSEFDQQIISANRHRISVLRQKCDDVRCERQSFEL